EAPIDRVTAEVHQDTWTQKRVESDVARVVQRAKELRLHFERCLLLIEAPKHLFRARHEGMVSRVVRLHQKQLSLLCNSNEAPGFINMKTERLFAQHVLPILKGTLRPGGMTRRR